MKKNESGERGQLGLSLARVFKKKIKKHAPSNYFLQNFRFFDDFSVKIRL